MEIKKNKNLVTIILLFLLNPFCFQSFSQEDTSNSVQFKSGQDLNLDWSLVTNDTNTYYIQFKNGKRLYGDNIRYEKVYSKFWNLFNDSVYVFLGDKKFDGNEVNYFVNKNGFYENYYNYEFVKQVISGEISVYLYRNGSPNKYPSTVVFKRSGDSEYEYQDLNYKNLKSEFYECQNELNQIKGIRKKILIKRWSELVVGISLIPLSGVFVDKQPLIGLLTFFGGLFMIDDGLISDKIWRYYPFIEKYNKRYKDLNFKKSEKCKCVL